MVVDVLAIKTSFQQELGECAFKKDWQKVLHLSEKYGLDVRSEVLWVFPTELCLNHMRSFLQSFSITNILSVGCGSGLLEFVLRESLGKCLYA